MIGISGVNGAIRGNKDVEVTAHSPIQISAGQEDTVSVLPKEYVSVGAKELNDPVGPVTKERAKGDSLTKEMVKFCPN